MANTLTGIIGQSYKPTTQAFLNNMLVARKVADVMYPTTKDGNTINWPYTPTQRVQSYTYGTDLTIDAVASTNNTMTLAQTSATAFAVDSVQQSQATVEWVAKQAQQSAYELANQIDQYSVAAGVSNALSSNTVTGGTLSASNINDALLTSRARLSESNAFGDRFAIVSPGVVTVLAESQIANGFNTADAALSNGYVGMTSSGFKIYESNNLKTTVVATIDTQPTATDTFTIAGVTWTCVADGTAAAAGEVNIGADLADFKTIFVKVINGTASADYVDVATDSRRIYQSKQLAAATFSGSTCSITGYGRLAPTETFTAATNVFGTATTQILTGVVGAISLGIQKEIFTKEVEETKQFAKNYLTGVLYDATVFQRAKAKLSKITHNEI